MDTYQRYLQYEICSVCGIPEVTLQGTVEDWQRIRDRIEVLATYDLDWWTSRLAPILGEFVATANGEPDLEFWQAIYLQASTDLRSRAGLRLDWRSVPLFVLSSASARPLCKGGCWTP